MIGLLLSRFLCAARLATGIVAAFPDVPADRAVSASIAITLEHGAHEPALLASIAWSEARFRIDRTNPRSGTCGPCQTTATPRQCRAIADGDERLGYRLAVERLDEARAWCVRRGTPGALCELATYASGPRGPRLGLYRQPRIVLARLARLRAALGGRPGMAPKGAPTS